LKTWMYLYYNDYLLFVTSLFVARFCLYLCFFCTLFQVRFIHSSFARSRHAWSSVVKRRNYLFTLQQLLSL
jgi:hypothetical protein